jgi:hypothetical protein
MKTTTVLFLILGQVMLYSCTAVEDFKVIRQVAGPIETNSYLIFGTKSKEAAIIDP